MKLIGPVFAWKTRKIQSKKEGGKELKEERHTLGKKILQKKNQERRRERKALRMIKTKRKAKENKVLSNSGTVTRHFFRQGISWLEWLYHKSKSHARLHYTHTIKKAPIQCIIWKAVIGPTRGAVLLFGEGCHPPASGAGNGWRVDLSFQNGNF